MTNTTTPMGVNFQGVQAQPSGFMGSAGEFASAAGSQIASGFNYAWQGTKNLGNQIFTNASPMVQNLAGKAQQAWSQYIVPGATSAKNASVSFLQSPLGKSFTLIIATIVILKAAEMWQENRYLSVALMIIGVACAMTAGMYLYGSGILPASFNPAV